MELSSFEVVLNYRMKTFSIQQPPSSFFSLLEIIKEKFDLAIVNRLVYYDEGEEKIIANDPDLIELFDLIDANELKEVELIINSDESKSKKKKSTALRKRSSAIPVTTSHTTPSDVDCINDHFDPDYEKDLRNLKHGMDDGRWSNQSYNQNELRRIYYIKEKKDLQRQKQTESDINTNSEEEKEPKSKNRKRELKSDKQKSLPVTDESDLTQEKGKNFYKNKKK